MIISWVSLISEKLKSLKILVTSFFLSLCLKSTIAFHTSPFHCILYLGTACFPKLSGIQSWTNIIPSSNQFSTVVPANGYLIVWFDKDQDQGPLHIGEKLSSDGEGVYLYNTERVLIDSVTFGVQETDISMGRYPDGSDRWVKFTTPTPAKTNN